MKHGLCLALLWPALAGAWEEEPALAFIVAHSPLLQAQRAVVASYQPPSLTRRVMEHTSFYVRAASGTSSTVSDAGDTTISSPVTVGIQINIPLASPREQREFTQQALAEATRIDEVRGRALTDLAKLRELEAERADAVPAVFTRIGMHFVVTGVGLKESQVKRAVELSAEKYCSASIMLGAAGVTVSHSYEVVEFDPAAG